MRNLSFALTTAQVRARTKTVTRRRGTWWARVLKPGDLLCAVEKSQGIAKGGLVRLGVIRVVSVRTEPLFRITADDVAREGFPEFARRPNGAEAEFVLMFTNHMNCSAEDVVTRIEFEHVEDPDECEWTDYTRCPPPDAGGQR